MVYFEIKYKYLWFYFFRYFFLTNVQTIAYIFICWTVIYYTIMYCKCNVLKGCLFTSGVSCGINCLGIRKVERLNKSRKTLYLENHILIKNLTLNIRFVDQIWSFFVSFVKPNWFFDKLIVCLINNLSESVDRRYWYPEDPPVPICALPSIRWTRITWLSTKPVFNSLAHFYFQPVQW